MELGHFVACERGLGRELIALGRPDGLSMRVIGLTGEGVVTLATGGDTLLLTVDPDHPVSLAADRIVGWSGDLEPSPVGQGTMEDMAIQGARGALKLRFKGKGQVIADQRHLQRS